MTLQNRTTVNGGATLSTLYSVYGSDVEQNILGSGVEPYVASVHGGPAPPAELNWCCEEICDKTSNRD